MKRSDLRWRVAQVELEMCDLDPARPSESRRGLDASRRQAARRLRSRASQSQCTSLHIARSPDPLSRELAAAPRVLGERRERAVPAPPSAAPLPACGRPRASLPMKVAHERARALALIGRAGQPPPPGRGNTVIGERDLAL